MKQAEKTEILPELSFFHHVCDFLCGKFKFFCGIMLFYDRFPVEFHPQQVSGSMRKSEIFCQNGIIGCEKEILRITACQLVELFKRAYAVKIWLFQNAVRGDFQQENFHLIPVRHLITDGEF